MATIKPNATWLIWLSLLLVLLVGIARAASPPPATLIQSPSRGTLHVERGARGNFLLGDYTLSLTETAMTIMHPDGLVDVWKSPPNEGFLSAALGSAEVTQTGHLTRVIESWEGEMSEQIINRIETNKTGAVWVYGVLRQPQEQGSLEVPWHGRWRIDEGSGELEATFFVPSSKVNRVSFSTMLDPDEYLYGGGVSYDWPHGDMIYAIPRFQGVGRGDQPLTLIEDLFTGQGGSHDTSQAPLARFTTNAPRTQWVEGHDPVVIDGRLQGRVSLTAWSNALTVRFAHARTPGEQIGQMMASHKEVHPIPRWLGDGFIVTDAGHSTEEVLTLVDRWDKQGLRPQVVWVQELPTGLAGRTLRNALHERGIRLIATMPIGTEIRPFQADGIVIEGAERIHDDPSRTREIQTWVRALEHALSRDWHSPVLLSQSLIPGRPDIPVIMHLGDLNADFSLNDGLAAAVPAMINANISGIPYTDVSVGGDTTVDRPIWLGGVHRDGELVARSAQLAVFSSIYRTGVDRPAAGVQLSTDVQNLAQVQRWYSLRQSLTPIRNRLNRAAVLQGLPIIRTAMVVQPDDPALESNIPAFFYGDDIYVVPVVEPGVESMTVQLPQGTWRNIWTGETHLVRRGTQESITVDTPLDQFPLFSRVDTSADKVLTMWAQRNGYQLDAQGTAAQANKSAPSPSAPTPGLTEDHV